MKKVENATDKIFEYYTSKLEFYANQMNNGIFMNGHNNKAEKADAIIIDVRGNVCPIGKLQTWSLNPLQIINNKSLRLSTFSVGGPFTCTTNGIESDIKKYNDSVSAGYTIVAYHEFG